MNDFLLGVQRLLTIGVLAGVLFFGMLYWQYTQDLQMLLAPLFDNIPDCVWDDGGCG